MNRNRLAPVLVAGLLLTFVSLGCNLTGPALQLLTQPTATPVVRGVVPQSETAPTPVSIPATPAASDVAIPAPDGGDLETQIYTFVYQAVNPSVVYIENLTQLSAQESGGDTGDQALPESQGSGFIWDTQGHIVTNHHVVEGADALTVTFSDGVQVPAEVIGSDAHSDVAVIKVDASLIELAPVAQGRIEDVQVGERAIAIGNPFGLDGTMTTGIVSAVGRSVESQTGYSIPLAIQTDAAINPGNSGGPLLNDRGEVIGINFQIASSVRSSSGVGFAIPINIVQRVVPALIKTGEYKHAWLGLSGQTYSPAWAAALGFDTSVRGAYVVTVRSGGPAAKGGLRAATRGDTDMLLGVGPNGPEYLQSGGDLIVAIDDQPVKTFDDLLIYLESYKAPGDDLVMTVLRPGASTKTLHITLGERPSETQ